MCCAIHVSIDSSSHPRHSMIAQDEIIFLILLCTAPFFQRLFSVRRSRNCKTRIHKDQRYGNMTLQLKVLSRSAINRWLRLSHIYIGLGCALTFVLARAQECSNHSLSRQVIFNKKNLQHLVARSTLSVCLAVHGCGLRCSLWVAHSRRMQDSPNGNPRDNRRARRRSIDSKSTASCQPQTASCSSCSRVTPPRARLCLRADPGAALCGSRKPRQLPGSAPEIRVDA